MRKKSTLVARERESLEGRDKQSRKGRSLSEERGGDTFKCVVGTYFVLSLNTTEPDQPAEGCPTRSVYCGWCMHVV